MAWRNLWRNRRRTLITLSSIVFGVMLAVVFTGMGDDSYAKLIDLAARMGGGHVAMQNEDYQDMPSLQRTITDTQQLAEIAAADPQVDQVVQRITGPVMLATARNSRGALLIAVDPATENASTLVGYDAIDRGRFLEDIDDKGIILGVDLAKNLSVDLGKKVVYTATDKNAEIVSGLSRVVGIVDTGAPGLDNGLCLLALGSTRKALGYGPDEATHIAAFARDQRVAADVAERLNQQVPAGVAPVTWRDMQPELAGFIALDRAGAIFFEIVIFVLVAAGIFNSLFMSVMERTREFGVMLAVGFSPRRLFALVMWESTWLGIVGLLLAGVVTMGPYYYLYEYGLDMTGMMGGETTEVSGIAFDAHVYTNIYPINVLIIGFSVFAVTLLSGIYPAWKTTRIEPVDAIRVGV